VPEVGPQKGLVDLAASVADGHLIDWEALEADAQSEYDRRVIRELRLIAGMAELHRTHAEEEGAAPQPFDESEAAKSTGRGDRTLLGSGRSGSDPHRPPSTLISAPVDEHAAAMSGDREYDRPAGVPLGTWGGFTLIEKVGEGAFGEVFRARDALHRDIALKLLRPRAGGTLDQIAARMLHEGRVMARIRHANVVDVYGAEEHEGRVGLSMEFVRGRTLEALLESQGTFSAREAALIGRELCRALAATHAAGLVHRDIKARNVMREEGGRVVLMDFGAGRLRDADGDVRPGRVTGTPLYLAPELFAGGEATIESDIYSVGILLFHLVTRSYPVSATSLDALQSGHQRGDRTRLSDLRPDLPDDFIRVIERAIDPLPERRYASAGAMQDALSRTLAIDPWSEHGFAERRRQPAEDAAEDEREDEEQAAPTFAQRWWLPLVAGAFLTGALATGVAVVMWTRAQPAATTTQASADAANAAAAGDLEGRTLRIAIRPMETGGDNGLARLLADQLQQDLSASPNFRVIASVAVDALRDRPASGLLQSLDADAVLEVSGERQGDSARGRLRIVRAGAEPLVAATPIQPMTRMRPLTERLAELSVERLKVGNTIQPSRRSELPLNNPDALQLYREGTNLLRRGGRQDVLDAASAFREATELEPNFVLAYAKWAEALLSVYRHNAIDSEHAFPVAQDAIAQALQRDERSGEAYAALGDLYVEKDRNWAQAEETFRKALTFNPSSEYARIRYALMLAGRGRVDEAVSQILEAQSLNPRSSMLRGYAGATLYYARRYEDSATMAESVLQLDPQYRAAYIGLCNAYTALGQTETAVRWCTEVRDKGAAEPPYVEAQFAQIYARAGQPRKAREHLDALRALFKREPTGDTAFWLAIACASLDRKDEAFTWLDRAIDERSSRLLYVRVDARLDPLRNDPRFKERLDRIDAAPAPRSE
jgi:eukaryotic-like serine/threonine-protein kinase